MKPKVSAVRIRPLHTINNNTEKRLKLSKWRNYTRASFAVEKQANRHSIERREKVRLANAKAYKENAAKRLGMTVEQYEEYRKAALRIQLQP